MLLISILSKALSMTICLEATNSFSDVASREIILLTNSPFRFSILSRKRIAPKAGEKLLNVLTTSCRRISIAVSNS